MIWLSLSDPTDFLLSNIKRMENKGEKLSDLKIRRHNLEKERLTA